MYTLTVAERIHSLLPSVRTKLMNISGMPLYIDLLFVEAKIKVTDCVVVCSKPISTIQNSGGVDSGVR